MKNYFLVLIFILFQFCNGAGLKKNNIDQNIISQISLSQDKFNEAYFASGCFWCVEAIFENVIGVKEVYSGYAGGNTINPTYNQIITGRTGHAETVKVIYDPNIILFETLLEIFFGSHDPTTLNRQGPDKGTQYRSIAFYKNENEKNLIEKYIKKFTNSNIYNNKIVTEVKELKKFYIAEEYHQNYEKRNPNNPYIKAVSVPRLKKFKTNFPSLLKHKR